MVHPLAVVSHGVGVFNERAHWPGRFFIFQFSFFVSFSLAWNVIQ
jgi:hypothetical protein